ncbi:uncharacterized protein LOC111397805 [Olea europaea var. sylvestris]|uniref:uncharacterized protein LOC111397805 n=1 Tax=Olea europaea var. sylvestris TaxID=158386 RepID=UPI000C1D3FE8|nr:uncharacterized protein LOC111397805 [Olea europaea var. sylvestris]
MGAKAPRAYLPVAKGRTDRVQRGTSSLKSGNVLQTHICKLNQSPWDVMSFSPPSSPPPPPPPPSFRRIIFMRISGTDNFARNGSLGELNAAFHRSGFKKKKKILPKSPVRACIGSAHDSNGEGEGDGGNVGGSAHENSEEGPENPGLKKEKHIVCCVKTDGKARKCKMEAAEGNSLNKHHLSQVRNCNSSLPTMKKQDKVVADSPLKPLGKKAASTSNSNSNEFYYYSGFGPRWGKKRGENNRASRSTLVEQECETLPSTFFEIDKEKFEIEYEEEKEDDESRRKRARKPIKLRSIKSLM